MTSDVERLRAFALVCDHGSVSAAATALGDTPAEVSQRLAALEREVGFQLVDRSRHPFRPTAYGAALRPHADRVLAAVAAAQEALEEHASRRLRLAAFASSLSTFVPAALRDLQRGEPDLVVRVLQVETREALDLLGAGEADLAIVHFFPGTAPEAAEGLAWHHLSTDPLRVVLHAHHRLAQAERIELAQLADEPFMLPRFDTPVGRFRLLVERLCAEAGFSPHVVYEVNDLVAYQAFAAAGISIAVMHELTIVPGIPGTTARPLAGDPGGREVYAVLDERKPHPAGKSLLAHLLNPPG